MKFKHLILLAPALLSLNLANGQKSSALLTEGLDGKLLYKAYTDRGDIIPDFSYCGYRAGGVAIPTVRVVARASATNGKDDTQMLQHLIDSVGRLPMGSDGFRGAVLIPKGTYRVAEPLVVRNSGVVLRGEGNTKQGTVLLACSPKRYNVIELGVNAKIEKDQHSERSITDKYVPSGSRVVHVAGASTHFNIGDKVIVHRPSTKEWIHAIGMDSITPRPQPGETTEQSRERFRRNGAANDMNGTVQWVPGSKDLIFERVIAMIDGDRITLDIPLVNSLDARYGGATIYRYIVDGRISDCGVEGIYGASIYDPSVVKSDKHIGDYMADENHANNFVMCKAIENVWIRDVSVEHFDCCVWSSQLTKFLTGQDLSAVNPISVITGGRRYAYSVWGQMNLFQRCYSSHHRHEFVLGASVAGPNAFVDGSGDMTFASSEPHQRWAAGCLYDNIAIKGPDGSLLAVNRSWYGSGHGWSGAQIVFWNCTAPVIMVMRPPTAENFAIGFLGRMGNEKINKQSREGTIRSINGVSHSNFKYTGDVSVGDGFIEHPQHLVSPRSLYYRQLRDRLGEAAMKSVLSPDQVSNGLGR